MMMITELELSIRATLDAYANTQPDASIMERWILRAFLALPTAALTLLRLKAIIGVLTDYPVVDSTDLERALSRLVRRGLLRARSSKAGRLYEVAI